MADLVEITNDISGRDKFKYFSKIKSKHIDFILCQKDNLYPLLLIELQDNSHNNQKRTERDEFVKSVVETTGYKILFTYGTGNLEEKINAKLNDR